MTPSLIERVRASIAHLLFPATLIGFTLLIRISGLAHHYISLTTSKTLVDIVCESIWNLVLQNYVFLTALALYAVYLIYSDVESSPFVKQHIKACLQFLLINTISLSLLLWLGSSSNGIEFIKEPFNFRFVPIILMLWFSQSFIGTIRALIGKPFRYLLPVRSIF